MKKRYFAILIPIFIAFMGFAQFFPSGDFGNAPSFDPEKDIEISVKGLPSAVKTGEQIVFTVVFKVPEHYHITKEMTAVDFKDNVFKAENTVFPKGTQTALGEVLGGVVEVTVSGSFVKAVDSPVLSVTYQACSEGDNAVCFAPVTKELNTSIKVEKGKLTLEQRVSNALDANMALALLLIFLGGILASLTPCVYPVIPLTMAYVGARSEGNKLKGFIISIALVLGIATTYSVLGILSATTGSAFGSITQSPVFIVVLGLIFIAMGLSMFGYYDIQLPYTLNTKLQVKRKGLIGAFLMGMATGVLAAPCVGPIIVVLLGWVAKTGSVFKGFVYLFDFALGMGVLFVLIGTFSSVLASLPKAGDWMIKVKYVFGILFILAALMFTKPILGQYFYFFAILFLIPFFFVLVAKKYVNKKIGFAMFLLIAVPLIGVNFLTQPLKKSSGITSNFEQAISIAKGKASKEGKIVVLDFFTDWCTACKELEEYTWENPEVKSFLENKAVFLKLNLTKKTAEQKEVIKKYKVLGYPTIVIMDKNGNTVKTIYGFINAEKFLKEAENAL